MNSTQLSFPRTLLPNVPGLELENAYVEEHKTVAILRSTVPAASCPLCGSASTSIHSHYQRAPADLPWGGHPVKLILRARKFFCKAPSCERRIFTERLAGVVAPRSRTTERLTALLQAVAFALGEEDVWAGEVRSAPATCAVCSVSVRLAERQGSPEGKLCSLW